MLTMMALAASMERSSFAERRQYGIKAAISEIKEKGERTSRISGKKQTRWGNEKGSAEAKRIMAIARKAAAQKKADEAIMWREGSKAVKFALRKYAEGWSLTQITKELGQLYDDNIPADSDSKNPYGTPTGCKPSKGTVSKWLREANPLVLAG